MREEYLDEKLKKYSQSSYYPFHMPGHKRMDSPPVNPYALDITEIDGFDNLHKPEGILLEAQEDLAGLCGAKESYFLVNGSTCGLLAAISAVAKRGDQILMARNCHKAAYHAAALRELHTEYLYPAVTKEGIQGSIRVQDVKKALEKNPGVRAVVLTSPTYDGILSDIGRIAACVHEKGIPLIVDEAHGAHLGFSQGFPASAVSQGADLVIQSYHKTLPALTQGAVLHRTSDRVFGKKLKKYLGIYQTSSPSYLLMASLDRCVGMLEREGEQYFSTFEKNLRQFYKGVGELSHLKVLTRADFGEEAYDMDPSKILIYTGASQMTGMELMQCLREDWKLELEMASGYYALAMTSIMDSEEGFFRLMEALTSIDQQVEPGSGDNSFSFMRELYGEKEAVIPVWEAEEARSEEVPLYQAEGRIAAETISLYPPGIPLILPGERIEAGFLKKVEECREKQLNLCGLTRGLNEGIKVVVC